LLHLAESADHDEESNTDEGYPKYGFIYFSTFPAGISRLEGLADTSLTIIRTAAEGFTIVLNVTLISNSAIASMDKGDHTKSQ